MEKTGMKIRALAVILSGMFFLAGLTGCVSETQRGDKSDDLSLFLSALNHAETVEYNGVQITERGKSQEKQYIHATYTKAPLSLDQRIGILSEGSFVLLENYLHDRGETADYSVKTSIIEPFDENQLSINQEDGDFTADITPAKKPEERTTVLKGEEKELMIQYFDQMILYDIGYLIEKNKHTFKAEAEKAGDIEYVRYDGTISADCVLERYSDFGRERIKAKLKMVSAEPELKNDASKEEMRGELTQLHNEMDLAEGIYELIFAESPAPVSIWIPVNGEGPYKIKVDYSGAYKNKMIKLFDLSQEEEYEKTVNYSFSFH